MISESESPCFDNEKLIYFELICYILYNFETYNIILKEDMGSVTKSIPQNKKAIKF
jgi:hypothetical protein